MGQGEKGAGKIYTHCTFRGTPLLGGHSVGLTEEERVRLNDSKHKIQSVANSLAHVDPRKVPDFDETEECLENADESLRETLRSKSGPDRPKSGMKGS
jgi:hypothetical protein